MLTRYFTFGVGQNHTYGCKKISEHTVVKITAKDPRKEMFKVFGSEWSFEYTEEQFKESFWGKEMEVIELKIK